MAGEIRHQAEQTISVVTRWLNNATLIVWRLQLYEQLPIQQKELAV